MHQLQRAGTILTHRAPESASTAILSSPVCGTSRLHGTQGDFGSPPHTKSLRRSLSPFDRAAPTQRVLDREYASSFVASKYPLFLEFDPRDRRAGGCELAELRYRKPPKNPSWRLRWQLMLASVALSVWASLMTAARPARRAHKGWCPLMVVGSLPATTHQSRSN